MTNYYPKIKFLLFTITIIIFLSCKKNKIEPTEKHDWIEHPEVQYRMKNTLNSITDGNLLYIDGEEYSFSIDKDNKADNFYIKLSNYRNYDRKVSQSKDILPLLYKDNSEIMFSKHNSGYMWYYPTTELDSNIVEYNFDIKRYNMPVVLASYDNTFLISVNDSTANENEFVCWLLAFDVDNIGNLTETLRKRVVVPLENYESSDPLLLGYYGDKFYVSSHYTYSIDVNGNYQKIDALFFYKMFEFNNKIYANAGASGMHMYVSEDKGLTWNEDYELSTNLGIYQYKVIDNRVIFFRLDNIWEMEFNEEGFTTTQLENAGIEGNNITSIESFNNKVYITSNSGVFYKDLEYFFTPKSEDTE